MAEKTIEQLQAEIEALKAENQRTGDKLAKANELINQSIKKGKKVAQAVKGTFEASWKDGQGKTKKRKVAFKDGATLVRLASGHIVSSECLLKVANGEDLTDEEKAASDALAQLSQEDARGWLTRLAKIKYAFLK